MSAAAAAEVPQAAAAEAQQPVAAPGDEAPVVVQARLEQGGGRRCYPPPLHCVVIPISIPGRSRFLAHIGAALDVILHHYTSSALDLLHPHVHVLALGRRLGSHADHHFSGGNLHLGLGPCSR